VGLENPNVLDILGIRGFTLPLEKRRGWRHVAFAPFIPSRVAGRIDVQHIALVAPRSGSITRNAIPAQTDCEKMNHLPAVTHTLQGGVPEGRDTNRNYLTALAITATCGLVLFSKPALAQVTVFSDTFGSGSTLNQAPAIPTANSTSYEYGVGATNSFGPASSSISLGDLSLTLPLKSIVLGEIQAQFTSLPVTLVNPGDYINLTVTFLAAANILSGNAGSISALNIGLYNSGGSAPQQGQTTFASTTSPTGGAQNWQGYVGRIIEASSDADFSQLFTRPAQTSATSAQNQELLFNNESSTQAFNSPVGKIFATQRSSTNILANQSTYTMNFRITRNGSSSITVSNALFSGAGTNGTQLFGLGATTNSVLTSTFDGLALGWRYGSTDNIISNVDYSTMDIESITVAYGTGCNPIVFVDEPQHDNAGTPGGEVTLSVQVGGGFNNIYGTPPFEFQWYYLGSFPPNGIIESDETNGTSSLMITNLSFDDLGSYYVTVSNCDLLVVQSFPAVVGMTIFEGSTNSLPSIDLGNSSSATSTVTVTGGLLTATNSTSYVGNGGIGQMIVSNGTVVAGCMDVGYGPGSQGTLMLAGGTNLFSCLDVGVLGNATGTVWITGGQLAVTNSYTVVGDIGVGQMTLSNGTWLSQTIYVGSQSGSQGTLTYAGGTCSLLSPSAFFDVGTSANGTGAVWITGGQLVIANSSAYVGDNGIGQMTVSNGIMQARDMYFGYNPGSQGTLTLAGGTNSVSSAFEVGVLANSTGAVWVTGGQLTFNNLLTQVGLSGVGQMTVSNGTVLATGLAVSDHFGSSATLTVAGGTISPSSYINVGNQFNTKGAVWVTGGQLILNNTATVGWSGAGQMTVSNGTVRGHIMSVGYGASSQGTLTIAGGTNSLSSFLEVGFSANATGAVWVTGGQLMVSGATVVGSSGNGQMTVSNGVVLAQRVNVGSGSGSQGTLTVAGGTNSFASFLDVGLFANATGAVWVTGGQLTVTNSPTVVGGSGAGQMTVSNGTVTVLSLIVINNTNGSTINTNLFTLDGGVVNSAGAAITNGLTFADGDGVDAATYHLLGGVHSFANGLRVRNNAVLSGCGTVNGNVVVDPGGTVLANCGGTLTVTGIVTNNGTLRAINGSVLLGLGMVVNNGTIDIINGGSTNFQGGFINNGTVLDASSVKISQATEFGLDFIVQVPSAGGHTYQLQYTTSLTPTNWTSTGASQSGTGGLLTFTDPSGATNSPSRFYRVDCTAP
jgi:T5SS/PEP-CTERM-associated repeat protein